MYVPDHFAAGDLAGLQDFIDAHPFAALVTVGPDGPFATHVPVLLDRARGASGTLVAHVARANPHWQVMAGADLLTIFTGPHAYVSPRWYQNPAKSVPTWNYTAVHVRGRAEVIDDAVRVRKIVTVLAARFEPAQQGWAVDGADQTMLNAMLRGIVGIEIPIDRIIGKFKLSQNRPAADRRSVVQALQASAHDDDRALAAFMAQRVLTEA
jgi:transcriptional regulator